MVEIKWREKLEDKYPTGHISVAFCTVGKKYMKQIVNFVTWVESTVYNAEKDGDERWYPSVRYDIRSRDDIQIDLNFKAKDMQMLTKIHRRFRTMVRKLYKEDYPKNEE